MWGKYQSMRMRYYRKCNKRKKLKMMAIKISEVFHMFFVKEVRSSWLQFLVSHVSDTCYSKNKEGNINCQ